MTAEFRTAKRFHVLAAFGTVDVFGIQPPRDDLNFKLVQISFLERSIWTAPEAFTEEHRQ